MKSFDTSSLLSTDGLQVFTIGCSASDLTNFRWKLQREHFQKGVVRLIRGAKMRTMEHLFDEIAAAFQFPYYFGENWDALDECLNDLEWLPGVAYLTVISDALSLLVDEPHQALVTFAGLMKEDLQCMGGRKQRRTALGQAAHSVPRSPPLCGRRRRDAGSAL